MTLSHVDLHSAPVVINMEVAEVGECHGIPRPGIPQCRRFAEMENIMSIFFLRK